MNVYVDDVSIYLKVSKDMCWLYKYGVKILKTNMQLWMAEIWKQQKKQDMGMKSSGLMQSTVIHPCLFYERIKVSMCMLDSL